MDILGWLQVNWVAWAVTVSVGLLLVMGVSQWLRSARYRRPETEGGSFVWIGGFLGLWLLVAAVTLAWLWSGHFHWWEISTWLSSPEALREQAKVGQRTVSELKVEEVRNLFGAVAIFVGSFVGAIQLGNSLHRTRLQEQARDADLKRLNSDQQRLLGERQARNAEIFARSVEQLAKSDDADMTIRIGAVFSLEALANSEIGADARQKSAAELPPTKQRRDSPLVGQIIDTLAAFVRGRSAALFEDDEEATPADIAAAIKALAEIPAEWRPRLGDDLGVDLRKAYLFRLEIPNYSDLRRFNLEGANLREARLLHCNLSGAVLENADLESVQLGSAELGATLLKGSTLDDAGLYQVQSLTRDQLNSARSTNNAILPPYLRSEPQNEAKSAPSGQNPKGRRASDSKSRGGLLDGVLGGSQSQMTEPEAILTILLAAAFADADIALDELLEVSLGAIISKSRALDRLRRDRPDEFERMNLSIRAKFTSAGRDRNKFMQLVEQAAAIIKDSAELAYSVFAQATDIVFANGEVTQFEVAFLTTLAQNLDLPPTTAREIVDFKRREKSY